MPADPTPARRPIVWVERVPGHGLIWHRNYEIHGDLEVPDV